MSDLDLGGDAKVDPELQEFLLIEKQKAQVNAQVKFTFFTINNFIKIKFNLFRFTNLMMCAGINALISQDQN